MEIKGKVPSALILTYARRQNCLSILNTLITNGCKTIYLYIDAPKTHEVFLEQDLLVKGIEEEGFIPTDVTLKVKRSETNKGVAISMINSLNWFFTDESEGIILEDDLRFGKSFLSFSASMLSRFRDDNQVMMISGNRYTDSLNRNEISWCNYPQTWGWATWSRSWRILKRVYFDEINLSSFSLVSPRDNFWSMGAHYVAQGYVDTWDIPIANYMIKNGLFTVIPPLNLVSNIGNDEFATHTKESRFPIGYPIYMNEFVSQHPVNTRDRRKLAPRENRFLEKKVFQIKLYHLFLPIKFLFTRKAKTKLINRLDCCQ